MSAVLVTARLSCKSLVYPPELAVGLMQNSTIHRLDFNDCEVVRYVRSGGHGTVLFKRVTGTQGGAWRVAMKFCQVCACARRAGPAGDRSG